MGVRLNEEFLVLAYFAVTVLAETVHSAQRSQSHIHRARSGSSGEITKTPELPLRAL